MIDIHLPNEYDALGTVIMRHAGPCTANLTQPDLFDPVFRRQLETSRWETYQDDVVRAQQDTFMDVLRHHGVTVLLAEDAPGCYSQHYTRDLGFAVDNVFIVARLNSRHRQSELPGIRRLVEQMSAVAYLDAGTIEGGDVMLHDGCVLVGLGEETSSVGVDSLRYCLERLGIEREVTTISFARDGVVHLDDHFNIVAPRVALIHPPVFAAQQLRILEQEFDLIPVTDEEALGVEVNTFTVSPTTVVIAARSDRIAQELQARGITPVAVDYSEVTKIPGAFRCSTLPLERTPGGRLPPAPSRSTLPGVTSSAADT